MDELGKNISGAGMDPNVIGRPSVQKVPKSPRIRRLYVRDITPECEGNAIGVGMADFTTWKLIKQINYAAMHMNAITSGVPEAAKVPMGFHTDREALQVALGMIGLTPPERARVVRIKNTLHLSELDCSEALLPEIKAHPRLSLASEPAEMSFDAQGNLPAF